MLDLEYTEIDGLLYPNIETGMEKIENYLSKYGILRLRYLHEHKRGMYRELLLTGKLAEHCTAIDKISFEHSERIQEHYITKHPLPEDDFWMRVSIRMTAQMIADEIVFSELIYT